jgi:hypothetical protein
MRAGDRQQGMAMRVKQSLMPLLSMMVLVALAAQLADRSALAENSATQGSGDTAIASLKQAETPTPESTEVSLPDLLRPVLSPRATPEATAIATPEAPIVQGAIELPATPAGSTIPSADAERFAALLASQAEAATLAGPFTANLKETEEDIALSWANVTVADFHASATVDVPAEASDTPWDAGFFFREASDGGLRLAISSDGNWYFSAGSGSPSASGPIPTLVTTAGGSNKLDVMVEGQSAWLGVNDELVGVVALPSDGEASDLALGSGYFANEIVAGRVTPYHDFVVRELAAGSLGAPGGASEADVQAFQALLGQVEPATPLAGPFSGRFVEQTAGTVPVAPAGVTVSDFGVSATFVNPASDTGTLWDFGFQFRGNEVERNRVVVDGLGDIYTTLAGQEGSRVGHADAFDTAAGASNTLQLFVQGNRAFLGVNGEFAAAIDLPAQPIAADVLIGAGFFNEDFLIGRVSDYKDFRVWDLTSS